MKLAGELIILISGILSVYILRTNKMKREE